VKTPEKTPVGEEIKSGMLDEEDLLSFRPSNQSHYF
jgi:hypothetical protein